MPSLLVPDTAPTVSKIIMDIEVPVGVQNLSMSPFRQKGFAIKISSLHPKQCPRYGHYNLLVTILNLKMLQPGVQNL